jgi:hypothetical protein
VSVYHDDNREPIQLFDEVVFAWQPWQSITPCYNLPKTSASTPIATSIGFENHPNTNINLVPINLEMEWLHLLNRLEKLCHIDQKSCNQSVFIPHLEHVEPQATPTFVPQGITYTQGTQPIKPVPSPNERSQVLHHRLVSRGNQGARSVPINIVNMWDTCSTIIHLLMIN